MALFRKFFYRKPPDGLLEISERVYVFDCCFTTDVLEDDEYKVYMGGIVSQLRDQFPDASFMVFNFREGETQSQIATILSEHDMTVMDYPRQYEGCPLLTMEMIHHFMRSGESWLSLGQHNLLLMHCERGGWPVLAFMLAALLVYRKQYPGEQKTLEMIFKQAPRELLQLLSPLNPVPSQLRYLQYISRRNVGSEWPPLNRDLTLDCIILRLIPDFDGEGGCRPIFRIYGHDPLIASDRTPKVLFSTPKKSKLVRLYKQADSELVKFDINCHIQGDVVLECISLDEDLEREEMMFRVMFNTAFIRSNILILNRDSIDILWDSKERFLKDFRVEILLSEMDAATSVCTVDFPTIEEKEGLPVEAFAKVQEIFNDVDWLETKEDVSIKVLQQIESSNTLQEMIVGVSPQMADGMQDKSNPGVPQDISSLNAIQEKMDSVSLQQIESDTRQAKSSPGLPQKKVLLNEAGDQNKTSSIISPVQHPGPAASSKDSFPKHENIQLHEWQTPIQRSTQLKIVPHHVATSRSNPSFSSFSLSGSARPVSRYHSAPSALGITALLHDHAASVNSEVAHSTKISPTNISTSTISAFETGSSLRSSLQLQSPQQSSSAVPTEEILLSPPQKASSLPPPNTINTITTKGADSDRSASISNVSFKPPPSLTHTETQSATCSVPEVPKLTSEMLLSSVHDTPSYTLPSVPESFSAASARLKVPIINQQAPNIKSHMSVPIPPPPPPFIASLCPHHPPQPSEKTINRVTIVPPAPPPPPPPFLHHHQSLTSSSRPCNAPYNLEKATPLASVIPSPPPPPPALLVSSNLSHFPQTLRKATNAAVDLQRLPPPPPPSPPPPPPRSLMAASSTNCSPTKKVVSTTCILPSPPPPPPPDRLSQSSKKAIDTTRVPFRPTPPPLPLTTSSRSTDSLKFFNKEIGTSSVPPATPPPCHASLSKDAPLAPPPPQISSKHTGDKGNGMIVPPPPPKGMNAPMAGKCQVLTRTGVPQKAQSAQSSSRKANLKPLHWVKVTRAMQGSLWAETQKSDELSKAPEFDMSELESLFSATVPNSEPRGSTEKLSGRLASSKLDKIHLIDLRRANNCEIMLTKVKIPLSDLLSSVLALDDSLLDADQIDNLIKFCPTKEEMELLKGYNGDKETLGKCEQYFLELMRVPRVESKLRVFSFKIQFHSQVSDLSNNLNIVNSAAEEIRNSVKLKRIMQTILSLGNALNQGTARGSAIGFRLDSLLKLTDTRARNNKTTLMHYLCKVLADKLPGLLDFPKDLVILEIASKIQLKTLAEEMQAISKGLEKVEQELIASENDGPVSQSFCKTLKEFLTIAEAEVRALTSRYSSVGRNADALALYFGEDPARCPFEQVVSTLLNFVKMFVRAHEENFKQLELEKKKAQKEAENDKMRLSNPKEQNILLPSPKHSSIK